VIYSDLPQLQILQEKTATTKKRMDWAWVTCLPVEVWQGKRKGQKSSWGLSFLSGRQDLALKSHHDCMVCGRGDDNSLKGIRRKEWKLESGWSKGTNYYSTVDRTKLNYSLSLFVHVFVHSSLRESTCECQDHRKCKPYLNLRMFRSCHTKMCIRIFCDTLRTNRIHPGSRMDHKN
jgi:hypothetical protein